MAAATSLQTASPKVLGKHLRAVRRRKGLSLSEVARGAGLSRRELVSYERGKVKVPESDLWVIAGSCGVDVAELVPPTDPIALAAAPATIEDSISQLRRAQPDGGLQRHLDTLYALRALPAGSVVQLQERERLAMAEALGGDAASIEARLVERMRVSADEAKRLRALVIPDSPRYSPLVLDAPVPEPFAEPGVNGFTAHDPGFAPAVERAHVTEIPTGPVDVFEELAKLPEPMALPDQHANGHEMFSTPPEPVSVHAAAEAGATGAFATWSSVRSALPEPITPVVVEPSTTPDDVGPPPPFGAAHQPPIDVVGRLEAPPEDMIEYVDEYVDEYVQESVDDLGLQALAGESAEPMTDAQRAASGIEWGSWANTTAVDGAPPPPGWVGDVRPTAEPAPDAQDPRLDQLLEEEPTPPDLGLSATPWGHQADPAASTTGFYVDWGGADEPDVAVPAFDDSSEAPAEPTSSDTDATTPVDAFVPRFALLVEENERSVACDEPEPISWRPLADTVLAAVAAEMTVARPLDTAEDWVVEPEPDPVEEFVVAGTEWQLGNALPLVEVRGHGGLVMRRADERWALADVTAGPSFALEVDVDFRSGPGFGVLFCASTDADGHMSGYSFDVDPIHEGGSYLVRQWYADRELWNPVAHVPARDPSNMHGALSLRVVVDGDAVTASVNGEVVLTVDSLAQACIDRNREPALGDRVGIQAWSSSDLEIDALRVAER